MGVIFHDATNKRLSSLQWIIISSSQSWLWITDVEPAELVNKLYSSRLKWPKCYRTHMACNRHFQLLRHICKPEYFRMGLLKSQLSVFFLFQLQLHLQLQNRPDNLVYRANMYVFYIWPLVLLSCSFVFEYSTSTYLFADIKTLFLLLFFIVFEDNSSFHSRLCGSAIELDICSVKLFQISENNFS